MTRVAGARARRRRFVPPQHGAWAMLVLPYAAGLLLAGWSWPALPLAVAWLAGYLLSYYALLAVKSRRPGRFRDQLLLYSGLAVPATALVVWARPEVLWYAPAYAALLLVNAWYAWRRRERALLNDLASVVQSCLMVFVVATLAGVPPSDVVEGFVACLLYFAGTAFYVKTMIRERGDLGWRRRSVAYHLAALVAAWFLGVWAGLLFGWLLLRAWLLPRRNLVPRQVGLIEIGNSLLLLVVIVL